jgi:hypothetical protein
LQKLEGRVLLPDAIKQVPEKLCVPVRLAAELGAYRHCGLL